MDLTLSNDSQDARGVKALSYVCHPPGSLTCRAQGDGPASSIVEHALYDPKTMAVRCERVASHGRQKIISTA